jgi:uncharacterized membrane protein
MSKYKIIIPKNILILFAFSSALIILRMVLFGSFSLKYIFWNIFLAFIPFAISYILFSFSKENNINKIYFYIGIIFWFLFIPNAPYIVTDLIHIGEIRAVPVLYDSVLLFTSALIGLLLGAHSIYHIEQILKIKYSQKIVSFIIFTAIFFISFGIFIGRFLRFNSWDIFENPVLFIRAIGDVFTNKDYSIEAFFYTILFFLFISMFYLSWKSTQKTNDEIR